MVPIKSKKHAIHYIFHFGCCHAHTHNIGDDHCCHRCTYFVNKEIKEECVGRKKRVARERTVHHKKSFEMYCIRSKMNHSANELRRRHTARKSKRTWSNNFTDYKSCILRNALAIEVRCPIGRRALTSEIFMKCRKNVKHEMRCAFNGLPLISTRVYVISTGKIHFVCDASFSTFLQSLKRRSSMINPILYLINGI